MKNKLKKPINEKESPSRTRTNNLLFFHVMSTQPTGHEGISCFQRRPKYIYIYNSKIIFFGPISFIKKIIFCGPKALAWAASPLGWRTHHTNTINDGR
jgi:hypothetical protein